LPLRVTHSTETKCLFCRMTTTEHLLGVPVCEICRDQMYDFLWASAVQGALVALGIMGGMTFLAEEVLLFAVLVFVKHRVPPPWGHA
jgi:hypothetical protein